MAWNAYIGMVTTWQLVETYFGLCVTSTGSGAMRVCMCVLCCVTPLSFFLPLLVLCVCVLSLPGIQEVRCSATDLVNLKGVQDSLNTAYPGSNIVTEFAFNGAGILEHVSGGLVILMTHMFTYGTKTTVYALYENYCICKERRIHIYTMHASFFAVDIASYPFV